MEITKLKLNQELLLNTILKSGNGLVIPELVTALETLTGWYWSTDEDDEVHIHKTKEELYEYVTKAICDMASWTSKPINQDFFECYNFGDISHDLIVSKFSILQEIDFIPPKGDPESWRSIFMDNVQDINRELVNCDIEYVNLVISPIVKDRLKIEELIHEMVKYIKRDKLEFVPKELKPIFEILNNTASDNFYVKAHLRVYFYVFEYLNDDEKRWLEFFEKVFKMNNSALNPFYS